MYMLIERIECGRAAGSGEARIKKLSYAGLSPRSPETPGMCGRRWEEGNGSCRERGGGLREV